MANEINRYLAPEELSLFCEQVGMILSAGIPLYDGMESLAKSYAEDLYGARFTEIYKALLDNGSLSAALSQSRLFPPYLVAMTRIGEQTGKLDDVMNALAQYYHWESELAASVKSAILYPVVLILMLAAVIAILVVAVLPVFSRVFGSLGLSMDSSQAAIMRFGVGLGKGVLIAVGVSIVVAVILALLLRGKRRERTLDRLSQALPFVRRAREKIAAGRFANVLSMMLTAGYNIEAAMELAPTVISDRAYREKIESCAAEMRGGASFVTALISAKLFNEVHEKMLTFGAAAGQLDTVMEKLSHIYREEADRNISHLVALIEPTLVSVLTIVVGGILLSVTLPLLSILSTIG